MILFNFEICVPEACLTRFEFGSALVYQYIVDLHTQVMESAFEKLQRDLQRDAEQQAEKKAAEAAAAAGAVAKPGLQVIGSPLFSSPFHLFLLLGVSFWKPSVRPMF